MSSLSCLLSLLLLLFSTLIPSVTSQQQPQWKTLAPLPTGPIHEHTAFVVSPTKIGILGGVLQTGGVLNTFYIYDIPLNTWTKSTQLPLAMNHANVAVVDGRVYLLGAMAGASWAGTPRSWVLDFAGNNMSWKEIPSMPSTSGEPRGSAVMGVYDKKVWLVSGKTRSGGESVATVSVFDTAANRWLDTTREIPEKARRIPEGRDHGGGGVIGSKFYQVGGSLGAIENRKDTVFVLDLLDLEKGWVTAKGRMPTPRRGFATGILGNKIYTFGGEGNPDPKSNGVFKEVEVYDVEADAWSALAPMKIPRHGSSAVVLNGTVYIPGGGTASGMPATDAFDALVVG